MMLASVPSSVTFAVSRETNEKENNTTHRVKGLALLTRDVPWCDEMSVVKKSRFLRVSSKRRRTTPLVSRRSMRDTTRYIYIRVCDTDTRDVWCVVWVGVCCCSRELMRLSRVQHNRSDNKDAINKLLSCLFHRRRLSPPFSLFWIFYSGWNVTADFRITWQKLDKKYWN